MKENEEKLRDLAEELKRIKQICMKKQENRKRMEENVLVDRQLFTDKESEVSQQQAKNRLLIKETLQKKGLFLNKLEDFKFLKHQLNRLQESV